jgi:hypothetical protein
MPKRFLEDMVQAKRQKRGNEENKKKVKETWTKEIVETEEIREVGKNRIKSRSRYMLWFLAFISVAFCFFALSFLFSKAGVTVNPKIKEVVLNENLSASNDSSDNGLSFDLVVIGDEENKTIQAIGEKDVKEVATGTVVIYNAFSSSPQALNIDTRLEGSNGKIYKTQTKTTVPGMGKNGTPGSVEVGIYGTGAGQEYNSAPLDFKIFGFKGTSKYSKIYARSKGAITGGFVGKVNVISDTDKISALAQLNESLKTNLLAKATNQIPSGFVLFKDAISVSTEDPIVPLTADQNNNFTITLKGTLYGILFNEQKLTKKIAEDKIDKYDGSEVYIPKIRDLTFSLSNKDNLSFNNLTNINFSLSGPATIVSKLDVNKFITDLLGKSKKDFNQILSQYPNIDSANLTLSPFWKMSIPDQAKNIKVIVNYPK